MGRPHYMIIYRLCINCPICSYLMVRDQGAEEALAELRLRGDLSGVPAEKLVTAARLARQSRADLREFAGKAAAQLNRDGMTWEQIGQAIGMPTMTIYNWAKPYM